MRYLQEISYNAINNFNNDKNRIGYLVFICLLFVFSFYIFQGTFDKELNIGSLDSNPLLLLIPRVYISTLVEIIYYLFFIQVLLILLFRNFIIRFSLLFSSLFLTSYLFHLNHGHVIHYFVWSIIPFLVIYRDWSTSLFYSQLFVSMIYFISGMNKIIYIIVSIFDNRYVPFYKGISYLVAENFVYSNKVGPFSNFFIEYELVGAMGIILVIILQLAGPFCIFFLEKMTLIGLLYIAFHIFSYYILGPDFFSVIPLLICIYILPSFLNILKTRFKGAL